MGHNLEMEIGWFSKSYWLLCWYRYYILRNENKIWRLILFRLFLLSYSEKSSRLQRLFCNMYPVQKLVAKYRKTSRKAEEEAKRLFYCFVCCAFAESHFSTLANVDKMVKNCNLQKLEWKNSAIDYWKIFATWTSSGNFSSPIFANLQIAIFFQINFCQSRKIGFWKLWHTVV